MRFLVIGKSKINPPPEMALGIFEGFEAWLKKYSANKKFEQSFSFAGLQAGGGIVNVDSSDELDAMIGEWPMRPFSDVEVYPLIDIQTAIQHNKRAIQAMMPKK